MIALHAPHHLPPVPEHGGPDGGPPPRHDFSTNANPLPAPEAVWQALRQADRSRYPDPAYGALRAELAGSRGLSPERVMVSAGNGEAIRRLTLAAALHGRRNVWLPEPGYGEYRAAAAALGLALRPYADAQELMDGLRLDPALSLVWANEPHNPSGRSWPAELWQLLGAQCAGAGHWLALDRAYEDLRLQGHDPVPPTVAAQAWQLWTPNKSLGLPGVRAGWVEAPAEAAPRLHAAVLGLAPAWVLSAEGVALLRVSRQPEVRQWLVTAREALRGDTARQRLLLSGLGWQQQDSCTPFWLARPNGAPAALPGRLARLREAGVQLRDARSFGLPGWVRLSTQSSTAQDALVAAWSGRTGRAADMTEVAT
jgi:histidinol-phosphate aminotransferase